MNGATSFHLNKNADDLANQLVEDLELSCRTSGNKKTDDLFLSRERNERRKPLSSMLVNEAPKDAGVSLSLVEFKVSSHGLHHRGCTSMKAAGHSIQDVRVCSGKKSTSSAALNINSSIHDPNPLGVASAGKGFSLMNGALRSLLRRDIFNLVGCNRIREV